MSAWVVGLPHIRAMVSLAVDGPDGWPAGPLRHASPDELGELLITECLASVRYRYPRDTDDRLPGPPDPYWLQPYRHVAPTRRPTAAEALGLLDCYAYQSCEHPGWEASEAHRIVGTLRTYCAAGVTPGTPATTVWEWGWE